MSIEWSLALQSSGCSGATLSDLQQMAGMQIISPSSGFYSNVTSSGKPSTYSWLSLAPLLLAFIGL